MNLKKFKHFYQNKYLLSRSGKEQYFLCYNYQFKALWFRVAKVGTRSINQMFLENTENEKDYIYSSEVPYKRDDFKDFFKFAFVREPADRLVSAWKDKVLRNNYFEFSQSDHEKMKTFDNFLEWVATQNLNTCDEHIRKQSKLIDHENLDFLGRFEDFGTDYERLKTLLKINDSKINHLNFTKKKTIEISESAQKLIKKLYEEDFKTFYN